MLEANNDNLKDVFKQAADIASVVPENMQEAAFNRALEQLQGLGSQTSTKIASRQSGHKRMSDASTRQDDKTKNTDWQSTVNRTEHPEITSHKTILEQALLVLKLATDEHGVESMMPSEIAKLLKEKFRIPQSAANISAKLGDAGNYVDRQKSGKGYTYAIMQPGYDFLENGGSGDNTPATTKRKGTKTSKSKPTTVINDKKTIPKSTKRKNSGKPTSKKLIEKLIAEGFFRTPKTLNQVIAHAQLKLGYTYKTNELSTPTVRLIRSQTITRGKNKDGQYEYSAS